MGPTGVDEVAALPDCRGSSNLSAYSETPCMKLILRLFATSLITSVVGAGVSHSASAAPSVADSRVYELRTYTAHVGKFEAVLARFRDHTTKLFEKQGMVNLGYWVPLDAADGAGQKLIYLLAHASREAATASWKAFSADPVWKEVRTASEVNGKIVAKVESVFLSATDFSPAIRSSIASPSRVFELRTYTTPEARLEALDARFRDHTVALFKQHGMTNVAYFHPIDADKGAGRTLIYLLAHASREAAAASFAAFRADPKWVAARKASEVPFGGSLTMPQPEGVRSVFLAPTDFSATK